MRRDWDVDSNDYTYHYPEETQLDDFCGKLSELVDNSQGVVVASNNSMYANGNAKNTIRDKFAQNRILFGGVVLLADLEHPTYWCMNSNGESAFTVAPIPLYRECDPITEEKDYYRTSVHSLGRVIGISASTQKYEMCTAFLEFQSTQSSEVLQEYFSYEIAAGDSVTMEMLYIIRDNIGYNLDSVYEGIIGRFFSNGDNNNNRWHTIIQRAAFNVTDMDYTYNSLVAQKGYYLEMLYNDFGALPD